MPVLRLLRAILMPRDGADTEPAAEKDHARQNNELTRNRPHRSALPQIRQTGYRRRMNRDFPVIREHLNREYPAVVSAQPSPNGPHMADPVARFEIILRQEPGPF